MAHVLPVPQPLQVALPRSQQMQSIVGLQWWLATQMQGRYCTGYNGRWWYLRQGLPVRSPAPCLQRGVNSWLHAAPSDVPLPAPLAVQLICESSCMGWRFTDTRCPSESVKYCR
jgi:hypothetical protein